MSSINLYSLLTEFARKTKSTCVDIKQFLVSMEKHAQRKVAGHKEWENWAFDTQTTFNKEIAALAESGKCVLVIDNMNEGVFIPALCREAIDEAYKDIDKLSVIPFPTAESLKLKVPDGCFEPVSLATGMEKFFEENDNDSEEDDLGIFVPHDIIILWFPLNYGTALLTKSMMPGKLMEIALRKISRFLQSNNNKDYVINKLTLRMKGREKILRNFVERIIAKPLDCLEEMERSSEFPYLFWTYFCPFVKNDINKKNELLADDFTVLQAVSIIEVCISFYRTIADKKRDIDSAFRLLDVRMERHPWQYTMDDILSFKNDKGKKLLDFYSKQELDEYIRKAVSKNEDGSLPAWLILQGEGWRYFVKKEKYLLLCVFLLLNVRQNIKTTVIEKWTEQIKNYINDETMAYETEFEKLLEKQTKIINPVLWTILGDPRLPLFFAELEKVPGAIPEQPQIFKKGALVPYSELYAVNRKIILSDIKIRLPFWYSIPLIVSIMAFFKKSEKKKKLEKQNDFVDMDFSDNESNISNRENYELIQSVRMIEAALVPRNKTLDEYLAELEPKWSGLLNKKARENLIYDVRSLLRDTIRRAMRVYKLKRITREGLKEMCTLLLQSNPALQRLRDKEALHLYMELYMLKLLLNRDL